MAKRRLSNFLVVLQLPHFSILNPALTNRAMPTHHPPQSVIISEPARVAAPHHDIQHQIVGMIDHLSSSRPFQHNSAAPQLSP